jgi:aspartate racemase
MNTAKFAVLGLGSRSTSFYLSELNRRFQEQKCGYSTCPLWLLNTDFNSINALLPNPSEALGAVVNGYFKTLEQVDVSHVLVPNITLHETIDRLIISKKIWHPIHLAVSKIKENGWGKVVLFGSLFSMSSEYISHQFTAQGIDVIYPSEEDMQFIDRVRTHIYNHTETDELIEKYHVIIERYTAKSPVILACTELSILKPKGNHLLLDMADLQIEQAVNIYHF